MTLTVKKDGHHFHTHINQVDPAKSAPQPQDKKSTEPKNDCKGKNVTLKLLSSMVSRLHDCPSVFLILGFYWIVY